MFKIEIKTGGAAFRSDYITDKNGDYILDPEAKEVRSILKVISNCLTNGQTEGKLKDINGNTCGEWKYEQEKI